MNVNDEEGSRGSKGGNDSQALIVSEILTLPQSIDNGRPGYV
jgi:hypothetical protein